MFEVATGCYAPRWPADMDEEPRLNIAKFGDGYEQRVLDGINWMNTTWKLTWPMRPRQIVLDMDQYLTAMEGRSFPFYDPQTTQIVDVFCDDWTISWTYRGQLDEYADMNADFRRANGEVVIWAGL